MRVGCGRCVPPIVQLLEGYLLRRHVGSSDESDGSQEDEDPCRHDVG